MTFDLEYSRWQEEQNKQINELRTAVNAHASDSDLRLIVDGIMAHYDEIFRLKGVAAKADVFHILSGMWKTPAERCFLWLGGFRSSELLKVHAYDTDQIISHRLWFHIVLVPASKWPDIPHTTTTTTTTHTHTHHQNHQFVKGCYHLYISVTTFIMSIFFFFWYCSISSQILGL